MTRSLMILLMAALIGLAAPGGTAWAQTATTSPPAPDPGNQQGYFVTPGLEGRTPGDRFQSPDDVILYQEYDERVAGRISIPNPALAHVVQPEGRDWRSYRSNWLYWVVGVAIVGMLLALAVFFLIRGRIRIEKGRSGRWVPRFGSMDRFAHWLTAISFIALGLTGLVITFGRPLLIPLLGHEAHSWLAQYSALIHTVTSIPFVLGLVLMLVLWVRDNLPEKADWVWIRNAGGILASGKGVHLEAGRFNAGQKILFWGVIFLGLTLAVTGLVLMLPLRWVGVEGMQWFHILHSVLAALMMAMILGHIYIGSLGMEGAFDAMGRGEVDENWAIEHHAGWYKEQRARGAVTGTRPARDEVHHPGTRPAGAD